MTIIAAIIDSREPAWVQGLTFGNAMVAHSQLDAGDVLATCDDGALLAIERKTPDDLLNSIREDRLWQQLVGIRALTPWAYLLITGELRRGDDGHVWTDGRATGWAWSAIQGALLQAQEMGVFVVYAASSEDFEAAVMRLAARSHRAEMLVAPARAPRILSEAERVLCALPGIGLEKVQPILEYTCTPAFALVWLSQLDNQERVPGIGLGTKRAIKKALGLQDDEEFTVIVNHQEA